MGWVERNIIKIKYLTYFWSERNGNGSNEIIDSVKKKDKSVR